MHLAQYLAENSLTQKAFAKRLGVTQGWVSAVLRGTQKSGGALARRIYETTDHAVTPNDLFLLPPPPPKPPGERAEYKREWRRKRLEAAE
jgi:transcriptional regulator with XRE-family HTH domain